MAPLISLVARVALGWPAARAAVIKATALVVPSIAVRSAPLALVAALVRVPPLIAPGAPIGTE